MTVIATLPPQAGRADYKHVTKNEGGRHRGGYQINCSRCANSAVFFLGGGAPTCDQEFADRRFRHMGWDLGRTRKKDLCPICIEELKAKRFKPKPNLLLKPPPTKALSDQLVEDLKAHAQPTSPPQEEPTMAATVQPTPIPSQRTPTPQQRRAILDKIDENSTNGRYKGDISDEKLAKALGVPRAWISEIREEFFGWPDRNERDGIVTAEHAKFAAKLEQLVKDSDDLNKLVVEYRKSIDALRAELKSTFERLAVK